jgi:predicted PurR-regulated permease PerM
MDGFDVDRSRAIWWGVALALFLSVVYVVYYFVGTFVFGLFIYYATRPAYERIQRHVDQRSLAAALSLVAVALPAIGLLVYTVAIAVQELVTVEAAEVDPLMRVVSPYVDLSQVVEDPASLLANGNGEALASSLMATLDYLAFVGNGLLHLFVMFALAFYFLRDGGRLTRWVLQFSDERGVTDAYLRAVDQDLESIFFGNILNAIATGVIGAISFSVLNVFAPAGLTIPYPALTGLLTGVASLIPIVGMKLVYVPVVGYLAARAVSTGTGYGWVVVVFAVALVVVDSIPDFFLRPYVSGRNLHVGTVMFAYILGPLLFGWYGIFLGPLILVVVYHFARIVVPELLTGEEIRPVAVDPGYLTGPVETPPPADPDAAAPSRSSTAESPPDDGDVK